MPPAAPPPAPLDTREIDADRMRAIGRLSGGVAHEFNNLLTVMQGHLDALADDLPDPSPSRLRVETLRRIIAQASQITSGLLASAGRHPGAATLVDVGAALAELAPEIDRLAGDAVHVVWDRADTPMPVVLGRPQLAQIVANLVMNARDAMPDGGRLTVTTRRVDLAAATAPPGPGRWAVTSFADTGQGMDAHVRALMFEPFFTTKHTGHGAGLGLSICRGLVHQAGGHIVARSLPGQGTTIDVYLPWGVAERALVPADEPAAAGGSRTASILLVEDEPDVREIVAEILRRGGHSVTTVGGLREARALFDAGDRLLDLLLTDLVLSDGTGLDVAALVAEQRPGVPVLFMSGYSEAVFSGGHPVEHLLPKPFTARTLLARVAGMLPPGEAASTP